MAASGPLQEAAFSWNGDRLVVTDQMKECFQQNGFIVVRSLLSSAEVAKLQPLLETDEDIAQHSYGRDDGHGRRSRMCLWSSPGDDITGMVDRNEKIVSTMEALLGGEVSHYHTKLIMKEAHTGGSFVWHQDYGYWYNFGFLFPDMGTAFIAIDKCDTQNGCLKVLKGSHKAGRIAHIKVGEQTGADVARVDQLKKCLQLVEVELEAGDALFFHSNLLHTSDKNESDRRRWAFLIAYTKSSNLPTKPDHLKMCTSINKVSESAIINWRDQVKSKRVFYDPHVSD